MQDLYESVKKFNSIAGNSGTTVKDFKTQQRVVYEECIKEVEEALNENNVVKLLDGVVDGLYVVLGQLHKLELMGCDIYGAIEQVCNDNLLKFTSDISIAQKSVVNYNSVNTNVSYTYNEEYNCYVLKDSNGKIRKPFNFVSTDLSKYVPKELQEKGIM